MSELLHNLMWTTAENANTAHSEMQRAKTNMADLKRFADKGLPGVMIEAAAYTEVEEEFTKARSVYQKILGAAGALGMKEDHPNVPVGAEKPKADYTNEELAHELYKKGAVAWWDLPGNDTEGAEPVLLQEGFVAIAATLRSADTDPMTSRIIRSLARRSNVDPAVENCVVYHPNHIQPAFRIATLPSFKEYIQVNYPDITNMGEKSAALFVEVVEFVEANREILLQRPAR